MDLTPTVGEIWFDNTGAPQAITGVLDNTGEERTVCYTNLDLISFEQNLSSFLREHTQKQPLLV